MGLIKLQLGDSLPQQNFSKSILQKENSVVTEKPILYKEAKCLKTTFSTGFVHNDKPVVAPTPPKYDQQSPVQENEDSIIESVNTGYGSNNIISLDCPKPEFKTHLYKENYLDEFKAETEKALARYNLGVYSKTEIHDFVSHVVSDGTASFITKDEVQDMLKDLKFVDSTLRSYALYDIPTKLFPL